MSVFAPGELIDGRYRIVEQIARGGMATVFEALDTRLDRHVALKVMHPALAADETYVSRFGREAKAAAKLTHPNIVAVHDQGEDDGRIFLIMELVRGRTLRQVLDEDGALSPRATLDIATPLAQALAAAHKAGLIHRDIKPENVIIREDGTVKVTDFGLARAVSSETATSASDALLGTVSYLAPEQVERGHADARSDIYAAGLVIFEMLTGSKAFTGENPMYVAYQHVHGGVPAPSSRVDSVPQALDDLVDMVTSRDPMERPADGAALGHVLATARRQLSEGELDDRPSSPTEAREAASSPTRVLAHRVNETRAIDQGPQRQGDTPVIPLTVDRPLRTTDESATAPEPVPARGRRRRGLLFVLTLVVAAILGGGAYLGWYFLAGPGSPTAVPELAEVAYDDAVAELEEVDLVAVRRDVYDERIPAGSVVTSDPLSGVELPRGSEVVLRVSQGPERYAVPTLVGTAGDAVEETLKESMLTLGEITFAWSETGPVGTILSTDPEAGHELRRGDPVAIVVSQGRQPMPVPNVTGQTLAEAQAAIEGAELRPMVLEAVYSNSVPEGAIVSQTPAEGTLHRGDTVSITPSKGPQLVTVPSVVGGSLEDATRELEALGLVVSVERVLGGYFNTVRSQSEEAGTQVRIGSTVTLTVV
ncbi:MAG: Stk1 family PASTA domain-containing Ser/Thr kinase [Actinomycetia bacterium]|nr:Stk1 family PASTA domain-containing Ser/Thr kinase [Actinomycetes bacterium]